MSARKTRVFHKLQLAAHALQKAADREIMAVTDLTTAQAAILSLLDTQEATTQRAIAAALGQNESAVTAMVNRLQRLGYLSRTRSSKDARIWELSITEEGRSALIDTRKPFGKINALIERELTDQEIERLADYLDRLRRAG